MAGDPAVLLMDEPFGAIDAITRGKLQDDFKEIQRQLGKTVLFVTHDVVEALKLGDRMIVMNEVEAGSGMGYSKWQLFRKVELPLALPVIIGGLLIASVSIIGIATIAAWIYAGGSGTILFEGLYQNSVPKMVWGTLFVSVLAVSANMILLWMEKISMSKARGEWRV